MSTHAIMIPLSAESPSAAGDPGTPSTPPVLRPRSDTILTTSSGSSSSSPYPQTPQTPSLMGVLNGHGRGRADSYGFEQYPKQMFEDTLPEHQSLGSVGSLHRADGPRGNVTSMSLESALVLPAPSTHPHDQASPPSSAGHGNDIASRQRESDEQAERKPTKSAVRAKLERSRSSLREAFGVKRPNSPDRASQSRTSGNGEDAGQSEGRRLRPRLRSLLSMSRSASRSASSTSVTSLAAVVTTPVRAGMTPTVASSQSTQDLRATNLHSDVDSHSGLASRGTTTESPLVIDMEEQIIMHSPHRMQMRARPVPTSTLSTDSVWRHDVRPAAIQRSVTAPPLVDSLSPIVAEQALPRKDLFGTTLPKELKIMVLKTFLGMSKGETRERRWDGEIGARRDLIKISRLMTWVSRSWQALCFDGQLWPILDLAPYASHLHPGTIRRIIDHSRSFITDLSLGGLDALHSRDLISAIAGPSANPTIRNQLPNLTTLDLRGCKSLDSDTILALVAAAPKLRSINLKGVQAVSSEVIRALARSSHHLESLDVSRCWDISLCDILVFVKMLSEPQAAKIKTLRISGLKAYGTASADLLPFVMEKLVNLETLDLLGCTHIRNTDIIRACDMLDTRPTPSRLRHLVLSGCTTLDASIFPSMSGRFPDLRRLELASLPDMFEENGQGDREFHKFLKSLANLERLDLEGTGIRGGVNDKMLESLTLARGETSRLVDLQIGYARGVTPEGMIRFIRACPTLRNFEADNTSATNSVMREFHRRHRDHASLSLVDCRAITPIAYSHLAPTSRPREGMAGYPFTPMMYEPAELEEKVVIKVFWSWRRVGVPRGWREVLKAKEREYEEARGGSGQGAAQMGGRRAGKGKGWWKKDDPYDDRAGCVVQ